MIRSYDTIRYDTICYEGYDTIRHKIGYNRIRQDTIEYYIIRFDTMRYDTIRYDTIRYDTIRYNAIRSDAIRYVIRYYTCSLWCVVCSGTVVVTAYDFESGRPGFNPQWRPICYKASINAQGLPEPSSLRGSTFGTRAAEHKGCNWACKLIDGCSLQSCVRPHLQWHHLAYVTEIKSTQLHRLCEWVKGRSKMCLTFTFTYDTKR